MSRPAVVAVVPSVGRGPHLRSVINAVMNDVLDVLVFDNWDTTVPRPWPDIPRLVVDLHGVTRIPGVGLYTVWNRAVDAAKVLAPEPYVLFLNDDIAVPAGLTDALRGVLDSRPDVGMVSVDHAGVTPSAAVEHVQNVNGTHRVGGFQGHAFMARTQAWPLYGIDHRYRIWYGDDDLVRKVRRAGWTVAVARGVRCVHEESSTVNAWPDRDAICAADAALWRTETGEPS